MVENGGGGWKGNNRDDELIGTKKKNPHTWEKNLHRGGDKLHFGEEVL
jgi:hypothetical protein